ncbi:hypothetical protein [Tellurirhabdus bombi]|uniref:hypothetical protein n=1 Tax=Tellurirhabdus bombi TaxID=2907205 RepID=UPI001F412981|nr:hypothetical protein [Tellurirhabdus bombi]
MRTLTQLSVYALLTTTLFTACSRQVATYQKMPVERFVSQAPVEKPAVQAESQIAAVETPVAVAQPATQPTEKEQIKAVEKQFNEAVASARKEGKLADSKKLEKRIARVQNLLAEASKKAAVTPTGAASEQVATAKKANFMERMMLKKMDKKLKASLAPEDTKKAQAVSGLTRLGVIIAIIGLILIFIPGLGWLGSIGIVVGLVLILLDLLDVA